MQNPSLPATHKLTCHHCGTEIFSTARCVMVKDKLYCDEVCADKYAIRKLRNKV